MDVFWPIFVLVVQEQEVTGVSLVDVIVVGVGMGTAA